MKVEIDRKKNENHEHRLSQHFTFFLKKRASPVVNRQGQAIPKSQGCLSHGGSRMSRASEKIGSVVSEKIGSIVEHNHV